MNVFSDVYSEIINILKVKSLEQSWSGVEADLKALCQPDGPSDSKSESLAKCRDKIEGSAGFLDKISFNSDNACADGILKAARSSSGGFQKRAAMLKTFKHFYFVTRKGNQSVWVVDHPKSYTKWAFDLMDGKSEKDLKPFLKEDDETFGTGNRKMMSDSLQLARKWSTDVQIKLGSADAKTLEVVKRWFHLDTDSDAQVKATATTLLNGFKEIAKTCNSTSVIFSDRPHLRTSGTYDDTFASVNKGDAMPVIYIFELFLKTGKRTFFGNIPKLWLCALTVVHELSHKLVQTKDIRYDYAGLKPGAALSPSDALQNADSWAYFAADLIGALSDGTVKDVLK